MAKRTLIVMSDSHGDKGIVEEIKNRYLGKVDAIFHNGDSELNPDDAIWSGIEVVGGNVDYYGYPERLVTRFSDLTVAQTHGHLYNINFDFNRLDLWAAEEDADLCLYGHLHRPAAWKNGKTVFLNPGSVSQPRGEINERLYAKVEVTDTSIKIEWLTRNHEVYKGFTKEFER